MTSLLYLLQVSVVILCPTFFGWVVLRRIVRENDWLVLLPGSLVVGSIAVMAAMNELRYWLEMPTAAWFCYKLLLGSGLALLVMTPSPRFSLRLAGGARRILWMWIAFGGTAATFFYFGLPAAHGFLNDSWWFHYPAATLVQDLRVFPIPSVFAPDDPLYYHFGPDILAGTWAFLLDCSVQTGFVVSICIFAPCTFLLSYALVLRSSRNHLSALAAASFLVVGGNLLFLRLFHADSFLGLAVLHELNSESVDGLLKLMFTPSHACGIPAVLLGIIIFGHFSARPSWPLAAFLGLWLGALTLVAEWYFFLFIGAISLCSLAQAFSLVRYRRSRGHTMAGIWLRAAPLFVAIGWGFFNNTYVSGIFGHFWMHSFRSDVIASARLEQLRFDQAAKNAEAAQVYTRLLKRVLPGPEADKYTRLNGKPPSTQGVEGLSDLGIAIDDEGPLGLERWKPPAMLPLGLNLHHFGMVPSWEGAGSSGGTFVPLFGFQFIAECTPVILLGLPFGLWLAFRRPSPVLRTLVLLAALSMLPPLFLDWGFRSTDFLRFFTGAFSFSALLLGWLVGWLWSRGSKTGRSVAVTICICTLVNPFIIGLLGLTGSTFEAVKDINQTAGSLKKAAQEEKAASTTNAASSEDREANPPSRPPQLAEAQTRRSPAERRAAAFSRMAELARRYLYPLTLGRERAIVIVPNDETPPTEVFPDWLKLATLAHVQLPIGWYWNDSFYAAYYREAVATLSPKSVAALGARWVIVSNLFTPAPPEAVSKALNDPRRFVVVQSYISGPYNLAIYHVVPYSGPSSAVENE